MTSPIPVLRGGFLPGLFQELVLVLRGASAGERETRLAHAGADENVV